MAEWFTTVGRNFERPKSGNKLGGADSHAGTMKTILSRSFFAAALFSALASFAHAGAGPQFWKALREEQQFKNLKATDQIAYVCDTCKTVSVTSVGTVDAAALCQPGTAVSCPACKMKTTIVLKRQRNDPAAHAEVTYVNEKGEECLFITKVAAAN